MTNLTDRRKAELRPMEAEPIGLVDPTDTWDSRGELTMWLRKADLERLNMAKFFNKVEPLGKGWIVKATANYAQYGYYSQREGWTEQGVVYQGDCAATEHCPAQVFISNGKTMVDCTHVWGSPYVQVLPDGKINQRELKRARTFWRIFRSICPDCWRHRDLCVCPPSRPADKVAP